MTIKELHKLARSRFSRDAHSILHDAAQLQFGIGSLKDCTAAQLEQLARFVGDHPERPRSSGPPVSANHHPGRPAIPAVVSMATDAHRHCIRAIASELRWTTGLLNRWLVRTWGVTDPDHIATADQAARIIESFRTIKQGKLDGRAALIAHRDALTGSIAG